MPRGALDAHRSRCQPPAPHRRARPRSICCASTSTCPVTNCSTRRPGLLGWQLSNLPPPRDDTLGRPVFGGPARRRGPASFLAWTGGIEWCCANLDEGRALTAAMHPTTSSLRCGLTTARWSSLSGPRERSGRAGNDRLHCLADDVEVPIQPRRRRVHGDVPRPAAQWRWARAGGKGWPRRGLPGGRRAWRALLELTAGPLRLLAAVGDAVRGRGRTRPTRPATTAMVIRYGAIERNGAGMLTFNTSR